MRHAILITTLLFALSDALSLRADNWPRFRGANGDGQSEAADIPTEWSDADYLWKAALPGLGHSSPVVWEGRVYLTSADPSTAEQIVLCYDLADGEQAWEKRFAAEPHAMHATNSFATSTPAIDADGVYLAWKSGDAVVLAAVSHAGQELWKHEVGHLAEEHGYGASPIVVGDVICLDNQTMDPADSVVLGFDKTTGREIWRQPRSTGKTTFATPCVWESPGGNPLIVTCSMGAGVTAYEPLTGDVVWNALSKDLPDRCVSSPILTHGLVLVSCGSGNRGLHLIAVRPGDAGAPAREAYRITKGVPNIPTPIEADDLLFLWHDRGTVTCLDAATGAEHWTRRVGGNYHSSPVRIGDKIYGTSLDGEVVVLAASKDYELIARNKLGEPVTASPAVAANRLLLRSEHTLFCVGPKQ